MRHLFACLVIAASLIGAVAADVTLDDFESYADSTALAAAYTTTGWPTLTLQTAGGAGSTAKWMEITDDGYSLAVARVLGTVVPSNGYYRLRGYYQNGISGGVTQHNLDVNLYYGGSGLATVNLNGTSNTAVTTWTAFQTPLVQLQTTDIIQLEFKGSAGARAGQHCAFDQVILEGPIIPPLEVTLSPSNQEWLTLTDTVSANLVGGSGTYTQVVFDVLADASPEFTDTMAPFEFVWDTTTLVGDTAAEQVTIEATVTDSALATDSVTVVYTVDNRFDGREDLLVNDFETWTAGIPDGWSDFQMSASGGNITLTQVNVGVNPENVHSGSSSLGVNFLATDYTNRYAVVSDNLYPGTGSSIFYDVIIRYWGKGSSNRMYMWNDTDDDNVVDTNTFQGALANSLVLVQAFSPPFNMPSDYFALAPHQFAAGDHFYDDVLVTGNQYNVTSVQEGLWNLYH